MITIGSKIELSVIVPVYNVEKHLENCVESLIKSCGDGCEIILVDDGSTDSSPEICGTLRSRYSIISVIRKQNGGLASARNAGINAANGEYITFVDSDDTVEADFYSVISEQIRSGGDIFVFPMIIDYTETGEKRTQELENLQFVSPKEAVRALEKHGAFNMACSKVYRRELLSRSPNTEFELNTEPAEDLIFNCRCFAKANKITLVNKAYYHWMRRGEDTLANRFRRDLFEKNKRFIEYRNQLYSELSLDKTDYKLLAKGNLAYIYACIPNIYRGKNKTLPRKERIAFYKEILGWQDVKNWLDEAEISGTLMKQFRLLYKTKSAFLMDSFYKTATCLRRSFDGIWQKKRSKLT